MPSFNKKDSRALRR